MAISKERLEELIKQGATIYSKNVLPYSLIKPYTYAIMDGTLYQVIGTKQISSCPIMKLENLYETEEQAKWSLKYHATRIEELNLPTWEDVNKIFMGREGDFRVIDKYNIELIYWKFKECLIEVRYKKDGETIEQKIFEPATEENYIKACDLCIKLFKGEENV